MVSFLFFLFLCLGCDDSIIGRKSFKREEYLTVQSGIYPLLVYEYIIRHCLRSTWVGEHWLFSFPFLYQGLWFHSQREDGTNPTSTRSTKRNRSSNNDSLQKHQGESMFTRWRHRILQHCSRSTTRGHASPIPLYHLSRLGAKHIDW